MQWNLWCGGLNFENKLKDFENFFADEEVNGASLSEPHTSELNGGIFIFIYISVVRCSVNASSLC